MFKLKKILNKHNNAPEFEILNIAFDTIGEKEAVYTLKDGELKTIMDDESENQTYYISYDAVDEMDGNRKTRCFRITPDMFFEVDCEAEGLAPSTGTKFAINRTSLNGGGLSIKPVSNDLPSEGYIVDAHNFYVNKKVLVRFHCNQ